jgi:hypothetical protein
MYTLMCSFVTATFIFMGAAGQDVPATPMKQVPTPKKQWGDGVVWFEYLPQKKLNDPSWGEFLTDIENHLPEKFGATYRDKSKSTWSHETTHGIHSHLNMTYRKADDKARSYGQYVGGNKACMIPQPRIRITNVAEIIPQKMRKMRYQLYLVQQAASWNTDPLYLYDEWTAYVNGSTTALELAKKGGLPAVTGDPNSTKTDAALSCLEFNVYALYVVKATVDLDKEYDAKQLLEFTAWNSRRSMEIYHGCMKLECLNWDNGEYLKFLQESDDALDLRRFVIKTWGPTWAKEVYGFKGELVPVADPKK